MRDRVARIERYRALGQLERFFVGLLGIIGPTEISRSARRDRQRSGSLRILRVDRQRAAEIGLRLAVVHLVLPIMMRHPTLVELVSVFAPCRPLGDALALEFEDFRLDRADYGMGDLVLQVE